MNITTKYCKHCAQNKDISAFGGKKAISFYCRGCTNLINKTWRSNNPEKTKCGYRKKYHKNIEKERLRGRKKYAKYKKEYSLKRKVWETNNRGKRNAVEAKRRAKKLNATPKWLSVDQIAEIKMFYIQAKELSWLSEGGLDVDHIVPLQGRNVCGLHVPWNLQIISSHANNVKFNTFKG